MAKITNKEDLAWLKTQKGDTSNSPLPSQLKSWGLTRDQYRSLYSKAASDYKKNTGWFGKLIDGDETNNVNRYLKAQMIKTNGTYGLDAVSKPQVATQSDGTRSVSTGGGGGGSSYVAPVEKLEYYTADELAKRFGIVNDYATILKEMQDATTAKFDETETTMKRAESTNLRAQESAYNQYLQDLRSRSANAVASGATKGTMAANALTSLLGFQESNRESTNLMNDLLYDTAQQRGTSLKEDAVEARNQANMIGQYLGNLSTSMDTNAINKYIGELAAEAQTRAASINAGATTSAARISANAGYDKLMGWLTEYNQGNRNKALNQYFNDYYPYSIGAKVPTTNK